MLGRLARWLRLSGYNTAYSPELRDDEIIQICKKEHRVLLTKDVELYRRAKKQDVEAILLEENSLEEQLIRLIKMGVEIKKEPSEALCPVCGAELREASAEEAAPLPEELRKRGVYICTKCGKLYWHGSHWRNIKERVERIERKIQNTQGGGN